MTRKKAAKKDFIEPEIPALVKIIHIYPTTYRYDETPIGPRYLSPGDELEVEESVLEWFLSLGKFRGGCCGIPLTKQHHFVLKQE